MRKICNNKVEFHAAGKSLVMRLSDNELNMLRHSSIWSKGENWAKFSFGNIRNFSIFAIMDYEKSFRGKAGRFCKTFNYHEFETMYWQLLD